MGCSSNPENNENTSRGNDANNQNTITEQTLTRINKSKPKEPTSNPLQISKSTNLLKSSGSIYKYKQSTLKKKISPYEISTIKFNESNEIYLIKINACSFFKEELIPIWFDKQTYIKFITKGKWRIDKKYNFSDSRGMPSTHFSEFNYGAAVARIGSGPNFLLAPNEFTYFTENEGPLHLRMNLPKNLDVSPEGNIEIKVFDGTLMSKEEVNTKIGWKQKDMNYSNKNSTDLENELTTDINDLRMNPILFYEKFLKNNSNTLWTEEFLQKAKLNNDNNQISAFSTNNDLYNCLKQYVKLNYQKIKKYINNRGNEKYLTDLKEQIQIYVKEKFSKECLVDCRKTKKYNSKDICIQYLLDTNFRENIFKSDYYSIAINIIDDVSQDEIFIILAFMID